jgi:ATP-dependent protease ClpP protease subunit
MAKQSSVRRRINPPSRSLAIDSPWARVGVEVSQRWELRKELIRRIGQRLRGKVIVYLTSFYSEEVMIQDKDAEMIENILSVEHDSGKILLVINSPGGSGLAAERIANVCRAYSDGDFEVIVPHMAKSAASVICFGASRIHMSRTAELGPVDPQLKYIDDAGQEQWISAAEYVRSYDELMEKAVSGQAKRLETVIQQLSRYDARQIEKLRSAQALSENISIKLLKSGMMSRYSEEMIKARISPFLIQQQTASHGRMISMDEARNCGLRIKEIELRSDLWSWIWELYIRADWALSTRCIKILESDRSGLSVS